VTSGGETPAGALAIAQFQAKTRIH
jgi:hypothetical protein